MENAADDDALYLLNQAQSQSHTDSTASATCPHCNKNMKNGAGGECECGRNNDTIPFWSTNPNILFDPDHITEYFPTSDMTFNQKLNAVSRTVIVATIIVYLVTKRSRVWLGALITLLSIFLLYVYHTRNDDPSNTKNGKTCGHAHEGFDNDHNSLGGGSESGSGNRSSKTTNSSQVFDTPSIENPMCNVMLNHYDEDPLSKKTAPPQSTDSIASFVKAQIDNKHQPGTSDRLFKSLYENLSFEQSLRPFHSMPATTIPNDQAAFAEFCYGGMKSCKEGNVFACVRNNAMNYNLY